MANQEIGLKQNISINYKIYGCEKNYIHTKRREIFYIHFKADSDKYIVLSYGNANNCLLMARYCEILSKTYDVNVICYDYFGFGLSSGFWKSEDNCYASLDIVMDYLQDIAPENICLLGHSLGTAVIIDWCSKNEWKNKIILVSAFNSIGKILHDTWPVKYLDKYCSIDKIEILQCPVQLLYGVHDDLMPYTHIEDLYNKLKDKSCKPMIIEGHTHDSVIKSLYDGPNTIDIF